MQVPSVGRIVHYRAHGSPDGTHRSAARAAIITEVLVDITSGEVDQHVVSLCVLNPTGMYFNQNVLRDDAAEPRGGTWQWPPFVPSKK